MSAGIEVYNDDGKLVIDENYRNLCMTRKILTESLPLIGASGYRGYVLKLAENEQLFAFELRPRKHMIIYPYRIDEKTWVLHFPYGESDRGYNMQESEIRGTHIYIFGLQLIPSGKRYGLEVYNSKGELCFDSNSKYMRVIKYSFKRVNKPENGYFNESPDYEYISPYGTTALVCTAMTHHGLSNALGTGGLIHVTIVIRGWNGSTLYTETNKTMLYYPNDPNDDYPDDCFQKYKYNALNGYGYMLLDVTNY